MNKPYLLSEIEDIGNAKGSYAKDIGFGYSFTIYGWLWNTIAKFYTYFILFFVQYFYIWFFIYGKFLGTMFNKNGYTTFLNFMVGCKSSITFDSVFT